MLGRHIPMAALACEVDGAVKRRLKTESKRRGAWRLGRRIRRRGVFVGRRRFIADHRRERVPVPDAERLGDKLKAVAAADLQALRGQRSPERLRHGLSVAEIAHESSSASRANQVRQGLALLTRSLGQRAVRRVQYVHQTRWGSQAAGRINRLER
jgi:hypothetical protein